MQSNRGVNEQRSLPQDCRDGRCNGGTRNRTQQGAQNAHQAVVCSLDLLTLAFLQFCGGFANHA